MVTLQHVYFACTLRRTGCSKHLFWFLSFSQIARGLFFFFFFVVLGRAGFGPGWALGPCTIWAPEGRMRPLSGPQANAVFVTIWALFNLA